MFSLLFNSHRKKKDSLIEHTTLPDSSSGCFCKLCIGLVYLSCMREILYGHYDLPYNKQRTLSVDEKTSGLHFVIPYLLETGCPNIQYGYSKIDTGQVIKKKYSLFSEKCPLYSEFERDTDLYSLRLRKEFFRLSLCYCLCNPDATNGAYPFSGNLGCNIDMARFSLFRPLPEEMTDSSTTPSTSRPPSPREIQ